MPSVPCSSYTLPPSSNSYVRIMHRIFLVLFILNFDSVPHVLAANAPIIGARCELGSDDVQIGGKQTQFFLRCEQTERSGQGYGEWVVKSRMASSVPSQPAVQPQPQVTIVSSQAHEPKQQYSRYPASTTYSQPIICAQDLNSREGEQCTAPMTCLQQNPTDPSTFLQCDPNSHRWTKKSCTEGMQFVFEKQTCTASSKQNFHRYMSPCLFNCPVGYACSNGTCLALTMSHLCMNGAAPRGTCDSDAACPPQYRCNAQSLCCPHTNVYCSAKYQCDIRKCPPNQFCSPLTQCCRPLISTKQRYTTCDSSLPCASDLICSEGRCIAKEDQWESTSTTAKCGNGRLCSNDSECDDASNEKCLNECCGVIKCPSGYPYSDALINCDQQSPESICPPTYSCFMGRCCPDQEDNSDSDALNDLMNISTSAFNYNVTAFADDNMELFDSSDRLGDMIFSDQCVSNDNRAVESCSLSTRCKQGFSCIGGRCCLISTHANASSSHSGQSPSSRNCTLQRNCPTQSNNEQNPLTNNNKAAIPRNKTTKETLKSERISISEFSELVPKLKMFSSSIVEDTFGSVNNSLSERFSDEQRSLISKNFTTSQSHSSQFIRQPLLHQPGKYTRLNIHRIDSNTSTTINNSANKSKSPANVTSLRLKSRDTESVCADGMESLSTSYFCNTHRKCPVGYLCQRNVCCKPLEYLQQQQEKNNEECDENCLSIDQLTADRVQSKSNVSSKTTSQKRTMQCAEELECKQSKFCPMDYTCLEDGQCCNIGIKCEDGTIPSHQCISNDLCPSSSQICVRIDEQTAICCADHRVASPHQHIDDNNTTIIDDRESDQTTEQNARIII